MGPEAARLQDGGWFGPREIVVPRAQTLHRRLRFPGVAPNLRSGALALAAERAAPEVGSRWFARWQGDAAHVWILPPSAADGVDPAALFIAESSLRAPPASGDAIRLLEMRQGVEGQVWREGVLYSSRWWPESPDAAEWARFLRASSAAADGAGPPSAEVLPIESTPWGRADRRIAWSAVQLERWFWRAIVIAIGLMLGWQLIAALVWGVTMSLQNSALDRVRGESAPLIEARERAELSRDLIERHSSLASGPVDYALIADVVRLVPEGSRLTSWFRDSGRLRVEVQSPVDDPRLFVQAFRGHPTLEGVVANPGEPGLMQLEVDLDSDRGNAP